MVYINVDCVYVIYRSIRALVYMQHTITISYPEGLYGLIGCEMVLVTVVRGYFQA